MSLVTEYKLIKKGIKQPSFFRFRDCLSSSPFLISLCLFGCFVTSDCFQSNGANPLKLNFGRCIIIDGEYGDKNDDLYHTSASKTSSINPIRSTISLQCQLLGFNCARPSEFGFSLKGFARRGGDTDKHSDGWGLAFYEGSGVRLFHDPLPAAESPIAEMIQQYPCKTLNMMAHIRYATAGLPNLENVHPFQREMWGIQWVFAHNGDLSSFSPTNSKQHPLLTSKSYKNTYNPVGQTDSEAVFCFILNSLRDMFDTLPTLPLLYEAIKKLCDEITDSDDDPIFNFLFTCGQHVQFVYSWPGARPGSSVWNGLHYTVREPPFKMTSLVDCNYSIDFSENTLDDRISVIATKPLTTNENWIEVKKGELILFDEGLPYIGAAQCCEVEEKGHGLKSTVLPHDKGLVRDWRHVLEQVGSAGI
mmetsp:Transcript_59268/g.71301  ORF Transcript_59268/g.71301 Transcript_59268/m.71301 type:complete len:418 (+) Transcript_59268:108-1361(+)